MSASEVGIAVRAARTAAGMSQAQLGDAMGLAQAAIWSIEIGKRKLTWEEGCLLRELIGFDSSADDRQKRDAQAYRRILSLIDEREAKDHELERVLAG